MLRRISSFVAVIVLAFPWSVIGQPVDSVDVTFYYKPSGNPSVVYLPGEFNNWGLPYSNGRIVRADVAMQKDNATGIWWKTVRLRVGGPSPLPADKSIPGAYQYKFNEEGNIWLVDPLNPRQNPKDNNNSYIFITNPTIQYLLPNSLSGVVQSRQPEIRAYIFPAVSSALDLNSITVVIDGKSYPYPGEGYDSLSHFFNFTVPEPIANGEHSLKLIARTSKGSIGADSTTFRTQAGVIQLLTLSNDYYIRPTKTITGTVQDSSISEITLAHNQNEIGVPVSNLRFSYFAHLSEGENRFWAYYRDGQGRRFESDTIVINYVVNHAPKPTIELSVEQDKINFSVMGNDPDNDPLIFNWYSDDAKNPIPLQLNTQESSFDLPVPATAGTYFISVEAKDPQNNTGRARAYFDVRENGQVSVSSVNSNPPWVRDAIVYEIYLPAFSNDGTFQGAIQRLPIVKKLGVNVLWLMPIFENGETINELNGGYNIANFYKIHSQLGTFADFQAFLTEAHRLGFRVILDITPNHVSAVSPVEHPWVKDVKKFRDYSNFRPFLETRILGENRGLGQFTTTTDGYPLYVHYSNWALANLNYSNIETVDYMLKMFKYWLLDVGVDGFRMDVYWGPDNRYGKQAWWRPFREEIKRVQPDVFILGETDGTGFGSENNYADGGGACDAAYDWPFYNQVKDALSGGNLQGLDNRVRNFSPNLNYNHYTGANAHYFRFLENQDETRIARLFSQERTFAAATLLLTSPGIPLVYAGQEVGERSRRGRINWQRSAGQTFFGVYQKLIGIRNQFSTFRSPEIKRISTTSSRVYAFLRPQADQNAIAAINFSGNPTKPVLFLSESDLQLSSDTLQAGKNYYLNDVLNDTFYVVTKSTLSTFQLSLPAWGSTVFIFADSVLSKTTSVDDYTGTDLPDQFVLYPNYPNPFNPETTISYEIAGPGHVQLTIVDLLGRQVVTLVDRLMPAGRHNVKWQARNNQGQLVNSGIYLIRLQIGNQATTRKIAFIK